jgi:hypothetical protein
MYQNWLKKDLKNGHTCSLLSQANQQHAYATEGLTFLKENKIVCIEDNRYVVLTEVLQWQESLRKACERIQERFAETGGFVPLRNKQTQPYEKRHLLKPLVDEQRHALMDIVIPNSIAVLSGMAGMYSICRSKITF